MSDNSVSLITAQTDITNWKNYCINEELDDRVKAFNIPRDSVTPLLNMTGVISLRAYIGLPADTTMDGMHVFIVGVDNEGNDILVNGEDKSCIMDFNCPCPTTCDVNSPLNI